MMVDKSLFDHGQNIVLTNDDDFLPVQLDLGAGVLAGDHLVAGLNGHHNVVAVHHTAGADGNHFGNGGLFLCAGGQDDAALGGLLGLDHLEDDAIGKRCEFHSLCLLIYLKIINASGG